MRLEITTSGNFNNTIRWLNETKRKTPTSELRSIGREGVQRLKEATPRGDTGQTAAGWDYEIRQEKYGAEVGFINRAHPEQGVNIAKLIELGHGTGTGGYVPPVKYIGPALDRLLETAGDRLAKEMFK